MSARELPYDVIADTFARTLAGVRDDQWSLPTPCEDWDVAQLVGHVVATHWRVYALCGEPGRPADGTEIDLRDAFTEATDAMRRAAHDPVLSQVEVQGRAGTQTFAQLVGGLLSLDTICHSWDLARATGQDETLDPDAVDIAFERLRAVDDVVRVPGGFAEAVPSAPDADTQTRFLNFAGRRTS